MGGQGGINRLFFGRYQASSIPLSRFSQRRCIKRRSQNILVARGRVTIFPCGQYRFSVVVMYQSVALVCVFLSHAVGRCDSRLAVATADSFYAQMVDGDRCAVLSILVE